MGGPGAVPPGRDNPDYARMLRGGILGDLSVLFWYCSRLKNGKRLLGGILFRLFAAAASGGKFGSIRQPQGYLKNFGMLRPLAAHAGVERRFAKALLRSFLKPRFIVLGHGLACSRGPAVSKSRATTPWAAAKPPSSYTAASTASSASLNTPSRLRPPWLSSPLPSFSKATSPIFRARSARLTVLTRCARILVSSPSRASGNRRYNWAETHSSSTASPKNSRRSLWFCPVPHSLAHELCVRARSSSAGFVKTYPSTGSSTLAAAAGSVFVGASKFCMPVL